MRIASLICMTCMYYDVIKVIVCNDSGSVVFMRKLAGALYDEACSMDMRVNVCTAIMRSEECAEM